MGLDTEGFAKGLVRGDGGTLDPLECTDLKGTELTVLEKTFNPLNQNGIFKCARSAFHKLPEQNRRIRGLKLWGVPILTRGFP